MIKRAGAGTLPVADTGGSLPEDSLGARGWGTASTVVGSIEACDDAGRRLTVRTCTNEFWTAKQRAAQNDYPEVEKAADELLQLIDRKEGRES